MSHHCHCCGTQIMEDDIDHCPDKPLCRQWAERHSEAGQIRSQVTDRVARLLLSGELPGLRLEHSEAQHIADAVVARVTDEETAHLTAYLAGVRLAPDLHEYLAKLKGGDS